jgi:hypothetical protein
MASNCSLIYSSAPAFSAGALCFLGLRVSWHSVERGRADRRRGWTSLTLALDPRVQCTFRRTHWANLLQAPVRGTSSMHPFDAPRGLTASCVHLAMHSGSVCGGLFPSIVAKSAIIGRQNAHFAYHFLTFVEPGLSCGRGLRGSRSFGVRLRKVKGIQIPRLLLAQCLRYSHANR